MNVMKSTGRHFYPHCLSINCVVESVGVNFRCVSTYMTYIHTFCGSISVS